MSADARQARQARHARYAVRAAAPLLLGLAAATASPAAAQAPSPASIARAQTVASVAPEAVPSTFAAGDAVADLRFEAITPLPDTLTLADLTRGVPLLVQTVTRDGRPVHTALTWRIVSGDAASISADRSTDREGYATAMLVRGLEGLPRSGHLVIEARTRPRGATRDLTVRLSTAVVRE
jgi:hypothetical protein